MGREAAIITVVARGEGGEGKGGDSSKASKKRSLLVTEVAWLHISPEHSTAPRARVNFSWGTGLFTE
jgi:hypothetical protein